MKYLTFFLLLLFTFVICQNQISITSCQQLQQMQTNDPNLVYKLQNDIDCKNFAFVPIGSNNTDQRFQGTLDGNGKVLKNLKIDTIKDYTAIFAYGQGATVKSLTLQDIIINSNSSYIGALFGAAINSNIQNCRITSTTSTLSKISSNSPNRTISIGGFAGSFNYGTITQTTIANSFISSAKGSNVGGLIGDGLNVTIINSYNLGNQNPEQLILFGYQSVGGLAGFCGTCYIYQSGIQSGRISSVFGFSGGVAGFVNDNIYISQIYSRKCTIDAPIFAGGLIGMLNIASNNSVVKLENIYSTSNISSTRDGGGLIGNLQIMGVNCDVSFSSCFTNSFIYGDLYMGNILGSYVDFLISGNTNNKVSFSNVFYNNATNYNQAIGSYNLANASQITGYTCNELFYQIGLNYNHSIWGGNRLQSEYNYSPGLNECANNKTCFYYVDNCLNCDPNPTIVDTNVFNVSCSYSSLDNSWIWVFANKSGGGITNNNTLSITNNTYFIGNFSQTSGGNLVFFLNSNTNSKLNVTGCIDVNGTLAVVVNQQPSQTNTVLNLINYSCDKTPNVASTQVQVKPAYSKGNCDKYSTNTVVNQNSLSVSLDFAKGSCGLSRSAILGIAIGVGVGVPVALAIIFLVVILVLKKRQSSESSRIKKRFTKDYNTTGKTNNNNVQSDNEML